MEQELLDRIKALAWNVSEKEYRADRSLSYSTIARYNREGFSALPELFRSLDTPALLFGSIVDCLLTSPEDFDKQFIVLELPNLTESLLPIAKELVETFKDKANLDCIGDEILAEIGSKHGYFVGAKYDKTRVKRIKEGCEEYFQKAKRVGDKTIVAKDMYQDAWACVEELRSNSFTAPFLVSAPFEDIQRLYQLKFRGEYQGIPLRIMIDLLLVDHEKKLIIPIDLKTSGKPEYEFKNSYFYWNYYIQSNLYSYVIKQNIEKDEVLKDYTIAPYEFIVISKKTKAPLVWKDSSNFEEGSLTYDNKEYKNWREIVPELWNILQQPELPKYPAWVKRINNIHE